MNIAMRTNMAGMTCMSDIANMTMTDQMRTVIVDINQTNDAHQPVEQRNTKQH